MQPKLKPKNKEEIQMYCAFKRSIDLKNEIGKLFPKNFPNPKVYDSMQECATVRSLRCENCGNMSIRHLSFYFCNRYRLCIVCARRESSTRAPIAARAVSDVIINKRKEGIRLLPCLVTLTIHRSEKYNLDDLLDTIMSAWRYLRNTNWWKQYFLGSEIYRLEIPYEKNSYGAHIHVITLRYYDLMVPLGVNTETGAIINEDGLRSQWTYALRKKWKKYMGKIKCPHNDNKQAAQADIHVAYEQIQKENKNNNRIETVKIKLTKFFKANPSQKRIEEKIIKVCQECFKYILKGSHLLSLAKHNKIQEYYKTIKTRQLTGCTGEFRKGVISKSKKLLKKQTEDEEKDLESLKDKIEGEEKWEEGKACPYCNQFSVCFGKVHLADAKLSIKRAQEKFS